MSLLRGMSSLPGGKKVGSPFYSMEKLGMARNNKSVENKKEWCSVLLIVTCEPVLPFVTAPIMYGGICLLKLLDSVTFASL